MFCFRPELPELNNFHFIVKINDGNPIKPIDNALVSALKVPFGNEGFILLQCPFDAPLQYPAPFVPLRKPANDLGQAAILWAVALTVDNILSKDFFHGFQILLQPGLKIPSDSCFHFHNLRKQTLIRIEECNAPIPLYYRHSHNGKPAVTVNHSNILVLLPLTPGNPSGVWSGWGGGAFLMPLPRSGGCARGSR